MRKSWFIDFSIFIFISVFAYAAISKIADYPNFYRQLRLSPLLIGHAGLISWLIPSLEVAIVVLLLTDRFKLLGLYASFSIMILFTSYIFYILHFSEEIPCSCGGLLQHMSWRAHLIFNISLILISAFAVLLSEGGKVKNLLNHRAIQ
jgi:hypothetical protein